MRTLANHVILYDADCPICEFYTAAFVKAKMLDEYGRKPYQRMAFDVCPNVDRRRAVNEIALVNTLTGQVTYGIHSLFKVIGNALPLLKPLFAFKPFIWLMSKTYALISYNRKVIMPVKAGKNEILPDFKLHYRLMYLLLSWLVIAYILTDYAKLLSPNVPVGNPYREYLICGGQIIFQGVVCFMYRPKKLWDYLGNMMTISLAGSLLLLPIIWMGALTNALTNMSAAVYIACFLLVAALMFFEHLRRCSILGMGFLLSVSWLMYRFAVLALIIS